VAVECKTHSIPTPKGVAEGVSLKWESFSLLIIGAPKGFLACCIFNLDMINEFGIPCAIVESGPGNPIGSIDRMLTRKISSVNDKAKQLGIKAGMPTPEALTRLF